MKKNIIINPVGLKGNQITERIKELMGVTSINENKTHSHVELTKMGPDGKAYAIVRENHEYYIKSTNKTTNIVAEDFQYIGGLQNKKSESYPSYAKAIKQLNFKFRSLAEAYNYTEEINVFKNDNLLNEIGIAGFSDLNGNGFSNIGNLEGNTPMFEEEELIDDSDVELTEEEKAVDAMLNNEEDSEMCEEKPITETHKLSINHAIDSMDAIIDNLTEGTLKKKV